MDDGFPMLFVRDDAETTFPQRFLYSITAFLGIYGILNFLAKRGRVHVYVVLAPPCRIVYVFKDRIQEPVGLLAHSLVELLLRLLGHELRLGTGIVPYAVPAIPPKQYRPEGQYHYEQTGRDSYEPQHNIYLRLVIIQDYRMYLNIRIGDRGELDYLVSRYGGGVAFLAVRVDLALDSRTQVHVEITAFHVGQMVEMAAEIMPYVLTEQFSNVGRH